MSSVADEAKNAILADGRDPDHELDLVARAAAQRAWSAAMSNAQVFVGGFGLDCVYHALDFLRHLRNDTPGRRIVACERGMSIAALRFWTCNSPTATSTIESLVSERTQHVKQKLAADPERARSLEDNYLSENISLHSSGVLGVGGLSYNHRTPKRVANLLEDYVHLLPEELVASDPELLLQLLGKPARGSGAAGD